MSLTTIVLTLLVGGAGWLIRHLMAPPPAPSPRSPTPLPSADPLDLVLSEMRSLLKQELEQVLKGLATRILPPKEELPPAPPPEPPMHAGS